MTHATDAGGYRWYALALNPEPWAVGPVDLGRKNGKVYGTIGRNQQLAAYQDAVREEIGDKQELVTGPVQLTFFFWRNRASYVTPSERTRQKGRADASNMGKALEDALQNVLFENDREVNDVRSVIVAQGPDVIPRILLRIKANTDPPEIIDALPPVALELLEEIHHRPDEADLTWGEDGQF
jgi:Holliday junction resolvase RusA-like endonuclease